MPCFFTFLEATFCISLRLTIIVAHDQKIIYCILLSILHEQLAEGFVYFDSDGCCPKESFEGLRCCLLDFNE